MEESNQPPYSEQYESEALAEAFSVLGDVAAVGAELVLDETGDWLALEGYPTSQILEILPRIQMMTPEIRFILDRGW